MTSILEKYPETAALLALANEAANRLQTLWFGFLGFGAFIVAAAWSASHRDLFLENPISLPLLNLNLPLTSFFVAAPFLMVILHFYLIVKLVLLARAFHLYEKAGKREISYAGEHRQFGQHINTSVFLQALYNDPDRHLVATFSLRVVIVLTIMALPLLALVLVQAQFLPHQSAWITDAHRIYIVLDILAIAVGWTSVKNIGTLGKFKVRYGGPLALLAAAMVLTISTLFLTFPGELFDNNLVARQIPGRSAKIGPLHTTSAHKHFGLFPATLRLAGEDFVDNNEIDLDKIKETVNLRTRSLIGADLRKTDLDEANFDGANLTGAKLNEAQLNRAQLKRDNLSNRNTILRGAVLDDASLQSARLDGASLQRASLDRANLQSASLDFASLQGASLDFAKLQGASLNFANLQGASLDDASLQRASLDDTNFRNAVLVRASLQGASFFRASLMGASLSGANLQGAWLYLANLQGASLYRANLQGASLDRANLQGALLVSAGLQGVSLDDANLQGAWLSRASLQGASLYRANLRGVSLVSVDFTQAALGSTFLWRSYGRVKSLHNATIHQLQWEQMSDYDNWLKKILGGARDIEARKFIRVQNTSLQPDARTPKQDLAYRQHWATLAAKSPSKEKYRAGLVEFLRTFTCQSREKFIAEGLIKNGRVESLGKAGNDLMNILLRAAENPKSAAAKACPGAVGLSDKAKNNLRKWLAENKT